MEDDLTAKFNKYVETFPNAEIPNYWECGSWEAVEKALTDAIESGKPWESTTPFGVIL